MNDKHYKLVTFDLDDTLWAVTPVIIKAEEVMLQWLDDHCPGVTTQFSPEDWINLKMKMAGIPELQHRISDIRVAALKEAISTQGYDDSKTEELALGAFHAFLDARHEIEFFDNTLEVLSLLKHHYILGALTNGNASIYRLGLDRFFEFSYSADDLGAAKPMPDHFLAAMQHTGVSKEQIIHVGDHREHDIEAAQQVGIKTVWANFRDEEWEGEQPPDATIHELNELPAAIQLLEQLP